MNIKIKRLFTEGDLYKDYPIMIWDDEKSTIQQYSNTPLLIENLTYTSYRWASCQFVSERTRG